MPHLAHITTRTRLKGAHAQHPAIAPFDCTRHSLRFEDAMRLAKRYTELRFQHDLNNAANGLSKPWYPALVMAGLLTAHRLNRFNRRFGYQLHVAKAKNRHRFTDLDREKAQVVRVLLRKG